MKQSTNISSIAPALIAAQGEIRTIAKDSVNPHFKNKYASLDTIVEAVRPILFKHGLSVMQGAVTPESDSDARVTAFSVETMLVHKSGEWISNAVVIPLAKMDPQGAGGALTYGRRYGLSALLSLATDEDDDAHQASQRPAQDDRPRYEGRNGKAPRDKVMPFGKQKGKRLGDLTIEELANAAKWCREKDAAKFADLITALDEVAAEKSDDDMEEFPSALNDKPDTLPFK